MIVAKTIPRAISSFFICNNKKNIMIFNTAPSVITFPRIPCSLTMCKSLIVLTSVKNLKNNPAPINATIIPIKNPISKSIFLIIKNPKYLKFE